MNIKIVYNRKLHKLQSSVKNLVEIRAAIKKLYPSKLPEDFKLLALVDLQTNGLVQIDSEEKLQNVIALCQKNNWLSLKMLVQDTSDQVNLQDLDLLNQSMIQKKPVQDEQNQFNQLHNQTQTELKVQDESVSNVPEQSDQSQQFQPESHNKECQSQVQTKESGQNPRLLEEKKISFPCFSCGGQQQPQNCIDCSSTGVHRDNDRLIDIFTHLIDERLKFYQLIQVQEQKEEKKQEVQQTVLSEQKPQVEKPLQVVEQQQKKQEQPTVMVRSISKCQFDLKENEEFETEITVKNKGKQPWPKNVELKCLSEQYQNFSQKIDGQLVPDQEWLFKLKLNAPQQFGNSQIEFKVFSINFNIIKKLSYEQNGETKYFGQKIVLSLNVKKEEKLNQSVSCKQAEIPVKTNQAVIEKAKEMQKLFPDKSLKVFVEFINVLGVNTGIDELIETYLQNN